MNRRTPSALDALRDALLAVHASGLPWRAVDACAGVGTGAAWRYSRSRKDCRNPRTRIRREARTRVTALRVASALVESGVPAGVLAGSLMLYRLKPPHEP